MVRNGSKSEKGPPPTSSDGDESRRWRKKTKRRRKRTMPVLNTTSPGLLTFAPKEVPSRRWPSLRTSVAETGASQGLDGPPSTPSMRDLRGCRSRAARRFRGRAAGAPAPARRLVFMPRVLRGARVARGVVRSGVAARAVSGVRAGASFQNAGAVRAARVALVSEFVRRAAARGRASVKHGSAAAGLHLLLGASLVSQPLAPAGARGQSCEL